MFIWTAKFPKLKTLLVLALLIALAAAFLTLRARSPSEEPAPATTLESNADRVAYLRALGWEVTEEPVETLEFLLPETLEEPYLSYNALQLPQGFDLGAHCGEQVSRYTYTVTNYPEREQGVQANLYVCDGVPVAGDIFCPGAHGFQEALIRSGDGDGNG